MSLAKRRGLLCASLLAVAGCLGTTLPLPPPERPTVTGPDENGVTHLQGQVTAGSEVYAYNRTTELGYFQPTETGVYDLEIYSRVGDSVVLWYAIGEDESLPVEFEIR